jgi:hypothetical protein
LLAHKTRGVTGGDDDDSEKLAEPPNVGSPESRKGPEADKRPGDGFTLYEEYRGFREKGAHFYGDPMKKDLFVRDRIGGRSKDGVALFEAITGIRVHSQFTDEEFPLDHIVNDNAGAGAHNVDQHGLVLIASEVQGPAVSEGLPGGTPGQHTEIVITESFDPGPNGWQTVRQGRSKITSDVYAVTIAHEMLHGVGVLHHGEIDPGYVLWRKGTDAAGHPVILEGDYQKDAHGKPTPVGGHPVRVMRENGSQMSPDAFVEPKLIWLGGEGGQHSGFENCVMRYDVAQAYERGGDPSLRYYVEEQTGISLCDRKTDLPNGVNGASHKPWPRYGNADEGDCFHQIKVRDD